MMLIAGAVLLLSLSSVLGVVLANSLFTNIGDLVVANPNLSEAAEGSSEDLATGEPESDFIGTEFSQQDYPEYVPEKPPKDRVNILLMGLDAGSYRSDTIILASLDNRNKKLNLLSIPRDTRIIFDGQYDKINHLIGYKGSYLNTIDAVKALTGLPIHYYAIVDFEGFRSIIDILGGVEIDVPRDMYYNDLDNGIVYDLKKGLQVLDGKQAEGFVRYRSGYADADLGRAKMQQYFLTELVKQKLNAGNIVKAPYLFSEMVKYVKTNYNIIDVASQLMVMKDLKPEDMSTFTLPGEGREAYIRYGWSDCFLHYPQATHDLIAEHFKSSTNFNVADGESDPETAKGE